MKDPEGKEKRKESSENRTTEKRENNHKALDKRIPLADAIEELRRYESLSEKNQEHLLDLRKAIVDFGQEAWADLVQVLNDKEDKARKSAPWILANIDPSKAKPLLIPLINDDDLSEEVSDALVNIGEPIVQTLTKIFTNEMSDEFDDIYPTTDNILLTIGKIQCEESTEFLNNLLDEYVTELPVKKFDSSEQNGNFMNVDFFHILRDMFFNPLLEEYIAELADKKFDPSELEWKFRNVDFFHILEAIVKQQNERSVDHLKRARDTFPKNYAEHLVCQIAIGRIIKHRPEEGFIPLEFMSVIVPPYEEFNDSDGDFETAKSEDWFEKQYGEYFSPDIYDKK